MLVELGLAYADLALPVVILQVRVQAYLGRGDWCSAGWDLVHLHHDGRLLGRAGRKLTTRMPGAAECSSAC